MTRKIPVLNGLRGIAIISVFFWHLRADGLKLADWSDPVHIFPYFILSNSFQGVALFFVLSAMVLYLPYAAGEREMRTKADIWAFYKRRAARLLPLYYLSVLLSMIYMRPPGSAGQLLHDFFLMGTATYVFKESTFMPGYNFVLWTLGIEIWFSILMPLLIIGIRKMGMVRVTAALFVSAFSCRLLGILLIQARVYRMFDGSVTPILDHLLCRLDDFAAGMLLAYAYVHHRHRFSHAAVLPLGFGLMMTAFVVRSCAKAGLLHIFSLPFANTLLAAGLFLMIGHLLTRKSLLTRLLTWSPLQMIGLMCYSLYVWHLMAMYSLKAKADMFHFLQYVFLVSCLSWFSYRYVENGHVHDWRKLLPGKHSEEEPTL